LHPPSLHKVLLLLLKLTSQQIAATTCRVVSVERSFHALSNQGGFGMWCAWLLYHPSMKDGFSCAHIRHLLTLTWGRPWSLPPFGPVSCFASLGGIFQKCAISPLTTHFWSGEMGVFSFTALSWLFYTFSLFTLRVTRFLLTSSSPTFQLYDFLFPCLLQ
jgi:hypothetical protein